MLNALHIQNFVIVAELSLVFNTGFSVLTGETGAGKSILIDALGLVLGGRAEASLIRYGADKADIQADFTILTQPLAQAWLAQQDLVDEDEPHACLLRRVLEQTGRSRAFINGRQVTIQQLRELGAMLVDIHGQHAHQSLVRAGAQRKLLDDYANQPVQLNAVKDAWQHWQAAEKAYNTWQTQQSQLEAERDALQWRLQELDTLHPQADEWQTLQQSHQTLAHASELLEAAQSSLQILDEEERACSGQLYLVRQRLAVLAEIDPKLHEAVALLESAEAQVSEAVYSLRHYSQRLEIDPQALQEAETRLNELHSMARKYRITPEELPQLVQQTRQRWQALDAASDGVGLDLARQEAAQRYALVAQQLTAIRTQAAAQLSGAITTQMQSLAMAGSRLSIVLLPCAAHAYGVEECEWQVAQHESLPLRPLSKVASGGELSRISLAIQVITSQIAAVPTLIFDEVDSGIGGRVADIVGKLLRQLGQKTQVLCITHLPQVAACAEHQWQVSKHKQSDGVVSQIRALDYPERIEEIARMLGGEAITDITRRHASEMLAS